MRILSVVGARPQFVKLAPIHHELVTAGHEHLIIHTGQHYDQNMSDIFFSDLGIAKPDENLHVGSGSHAAQTAAMMVGLETSFLLHNPDWVLAYGDTNSTLAAAIAAVKIQQPLAHLEAGLRSHNYLMPEEHNRVLTDHSADLLLAPTKVAMQHLLNEGLGDRAVLVGDVMADVCFQTRDRVSKDQPVMPEGWRENTDYLIATIHRQENTDNPVRLKMILDYLGTSSRSVRLLAHPRLKQKAREASISLDNGSVQSFDPLSYPQLVHAVMRSKGVITDSGGLQKESFLLRVPCITVRSETEWPETLAGGWNTLVPDCAQIVDDIFSEERSPLDDQPYGDGNAASACVLEMERSLANRG